jgi:hypothetical protein
VACAAGPQFRCFIGTLAILPRVSPRRALKLPREIVWRSQFSPIRDYAD